MKGERGEVCVVSRPDSHQHGCEWIPHYLCFHCSQNALGYRCPWATLNTACVSL